MFFHWGPFIFQLGLSPMGANVYFLHSGANVVGKLENVFFLFGSFFPIGDNSPANVLVEFKNVF